MTRLCLFEGGMQREIGNESMSTCIRVAKLSPATSHNGGKGDGKIRHQPPCNRRKRLRNGRNAAQLTASAPATLPGTGGEGLGRLPNAQRFQDKAFNGSNYGSQRHGAALPPDARGYRSRCGHSRPSSTVSPWTRHRDLHPAGSFPGGFRTPAQRTAPLTEGRHPKPFTSTDLQRSRCRRRFSAANSDIVFWTRRGLPPESARRFSQRRGFG
jgi:hypothetical protein